MHGKSHLPPPPVGANGEPLLVPPAEFSDQEEEDLLADVEWP